MLYIRKMCIINIINVEKHIIVLIYVHKKRMMSMNFIQTPNLPDKKVILALVDGRISGDLENAFKRLNIETLKTSKHPDVYEAVAYHPDIAFHHISRNKIIYAPGTNQLLVDNLKRRGFIMIEGSTRLSKVYPQSAAYNVARVGNIAFHNFNITDPVLKKALEEEGVKMVQVRQGYTRCSTAILNEHNIITSDKGIAEAAIKNGINALLIEPQKSIVLPGLDYGFLGGSSGLIDKNLWAIAGNLEKLEASEQIAEYLDKTGVKAISLSDDYVVDVGTIMPLATE